MDKIYERTVSRLCDNKHSWTVIREKGNKIGFKSTLTFCLQTLIGHSKRSWETQAKCGAFAEIGVPQLCICRGGYQSRGNKQRVSEVFMGFPLYLYLNVYLQCETLRPGRQNSEGAMSWIISMAQTAVEYVQILSSPVGKTSLTTQ